MGLSVIAALTQERVIGLKGGLPWRLPEDLRRFKRLTMGHTLLMGRKTWDSLPKKPLPGRLNLVLSRAEKVEGAVRVGGLEEARGLAQGELFAIGGESVFREALPAADRLLLTWILHPFEGDVRFPELDLSAFKETARERHQAAEGWGYEYVDYQRRKA